MGHLGEISRFTLVCLALSGLSVSPVNASTIQAFGTGTAVTSIDFSAEFESATGLYNPYLEGGLSFQNSDTSRELQISNLEGNTFAGLAGVNDSRALYRGQITSPLVVSTQDGSELSGLEFNIGTGSSAARRNSGYWETYRDGAIIGSGGFLVTDFEQKISFADVQGFDMLFIAMMFGNVSIPPTGFNNTNVIAIDHLTAQAAQALSTVPVPAAAWLFGTALIGLVGISRRRKPAQVFCPEKSSNVG